MKLPEVAYIYGLYDIENPELMVYIGKTNNQYIRLSYYKKDAYKVFSPVYKWVRRLLDENKTPKLKVLEVCKFKNWKSREKRLISIWRKINPALLNILDGGNGSSIKGIKKFCDKCGTKRKKLFLKDNSLRCPKCRPAERKLYFNGAVRSRYKAYYVGYTTSHKKEKKEYDRLRRKRIRASNRYRFN